MARCALLFYCLFFLTVNAQQNTFDDDDICTVQASTVLHELSKCAKDTSVNTASLINNHLESKMKVLSEKVDSLLEQVGQIARDLKKAITPVNAKECSKYRKSMDADRPNIVNATGTQFYFNVANKANWTNARDLCQEKGMVQATLQNSKKIEEVTQVLLERGLKGLGFWLSASDIDKTPGQFYWVDGSQVDNDMWYRGEPNDFDKGKQTCVWLHTEITKLVDEKCENLLHILCEVPEALKSCF